jgi:hypothetical protein
MLNGLFTKVAEMQGKVVNTSSVERGRLKLSERVYSAYTENSIAVACLSNKSFFIVWTPNTILVTKTNT